MDNNCLALVVSHELSITKSIQVSCLFDKNELIANLAKSMNLSLEYIDDIFIFESCCIENEHKVNLKYHWTIGRDYLHG